jgi:hypothetical protein
MEKRTNQGTLNPSFMEENGHRFFALRRRPVTHAFQQFGHVGDIAELPLQYGASDSTLLNCSHPLKGFVSLGAGLDRAQHGH